MIIKVIMSNISLQFCYSPGMIDIQQYRVVVGIFNVRVYIGSKSKCNWYGKNGLLFEIIALIIHFLILLCGDIEENPGPRGYKVCPQCKISIVVSTKLCSCGYRFNKKGRPCHANSSYKSTGRPVGTNRIAGFNVSSGRPVGTTHASGFNASNGRKVGSTRDAGFDVSTGRPVGTTCDAGFDVSTGRPVGTTHLAGFNVSGGRPLGTTHENGAKTSLIEDNESELTEHIRQYDLPITWNTGVESLSLNDDMLKRGRKCIGQQIRFDSKPLGIGMCYCCGSVLWSRVDNCHTNLVNIDTEEKNIPARAYLKFMCHNNNSEIVLQYRHKSGKLFACTVCKSFKSPSEFNSEMHVGKVKVDDDVLPVHEWDMTYPQEILSLKNQTECCQISLCGVFSTVVKDAKQHQWRHLQGEVNSLHKLDKHYYGLFGFMLLNEKISDELTKYPEACERVRKALSWLKKNNHLYKKLLARYETMYRFIRDNVANPEILKIDYQDILQE